MQNRTEPPQAADHSTPELVKQLADDSATLVRQEIQLAKSEMSEKIDELKAEIRWSLEEGRAVTSENLNAVKGEASTKAKIMGAAAGLYGAGGAIALLGLGALTGALILALDGVMPNWAAALLVGAVYLLIAYLLYRSGKARMSKATPFLSPKHDRPRQVELRRAGRTAQGTRRRGSTGSRTDHRNAEGGQGMAQEPDAIREEIEDTRERMSETVDALSYKTDVKSRMKNAVSSQKDKLMGTVSDNTPDPGQVKEKAKQGVGIAKENPLALAVGGLALGFLGGLLAPSTRMEDEKIGDVSDKVTDTIKETGQEAMERGKSVAQEAVGAAEESGKQEAQKLGEGLKERVQETQAETVQQQ